MRKWRRGREGSMSLWEERVGGKRREERGRKENEEGRALPIVQGVRIEEREIR
jgi:hypothetical protein